MRSSFHGSQYLSFRNGKTKRAKEIDVHVYVFYKVRCLSETFSIGNHMISNAICNK